MDCETFASALSRRLDGELSAQEEMELRAHAAQCPECAALLSVMEDAHGALAHFDDGVQVPEDFAQGWRDAVRREAFRQKRRPGRAVLRAFSGVAAALLLMVGTTALWRAGSLPVAYPGAAQVASEAEGAAAAPRIAAFDAGVLPEEGEQPEAPSPRLRSMQPEVPAPAMAEPEAVTASRPFLQDLAALSGLVLPWALGALGVVGLLGVGLKIVKQRKRRE